MEEFVKGDIVVVPFPFSDLSSIKRRPAYVLAQLSGPDVILCQITSKQKDDPTAIELKIADYNSGALGLVSFIRPSRIFTAEKSIIQYKVGSVHKLKIDEIQAVLKSLFGL